MTKEIRGLSAEEVEERRRQGLDNCEINPPTKTVGDILKSNILTYFNGIFLLLAIGVIIAGQFKNLTFMIIVMANTAIGIVQELKSKRELDKLTLLTGRKCTVIRGGREKSVDVHDTVRDDIVIFESGAQIFADAVVVDGSVIVNEALITGEADEIKKSVGDELISGSFVMTGNCAARLTAVGEASFASKLTIEAKKSGKQRKSEMMRSLTRLVKVIGILLIPLGILSLVKEIKWLGHDYREGIIKTVASLLGMIPEGLYLLTSLALVASVVRLMRQRTLVHEMDCIETLARVDTLCVDKTGTITENKMTVEKVVLLAEDRSVPEISQIMSDYVFAHQADNATMLALKDYFKGASYRTAQFILPFVSSRKYGGTMFENGTFLLGGPDVILGDRYDMIAPVVEEYSAKGCRVLLLAQTDVDLRYSPSPGEAEPVALILLANKIRDTAPDTFRFFAENNVQVKVISGDNAQAVSEVARRAGIEGSELYVDARSLETDEQIARAAQQYNVFGRVTPEQKRKLIRALRAAGHTVAMTGDGVNDVLALKEADCSVAMASGAEITAQVSNIVLLDSDFSAMPSVVSEGRRVINNIERSAALYLWKNIFSFVLTLVTLLFTLTYPLEPVQLTLISALMIGAPSFVLAMEPNKSLVRGHFMKNVLNRALPAALTNFLMILGVLMFDRAFEISENPAMKGQVSTVCTLIMALVGLLMLLSTSSPFNKIRIALCAAMALGTVIGVLAMSGFFSLVPLEFKTKLIFGVFAIMSVPTFIGIKMLTERAGDWLTVLRRKFEAARDA